MTKPSNLSFQRFAYTALLIILGTLSYSNSFQGPFLFDGLYHIANNPSIRDLGDINALFRSGYQETRPVFVFSLALCYHFVGSEVWLYHLLNLLLHLGCALLLFQTTSHLLLARQDTAPHTPFVVACFFVLHPLTTESVTYINSRSVLLMTLFGLLSFRSYLNFLSQSGNARFLTYGLSLLYFLLALGSKESAVILPLLFGITVWLCRVDVARSKRWWLTLLPYAGCILVLPLLYLLVTNPHPNNPYPQMFPVWAHIMTQARVFGWFLLLSFVPLYHNFDYDFRFTTSLFDAEFFLALVLWMALLLLGWKLRRKQPLFLLGLLCFGFFLAPTNPIVLRDFVAERYLYTSLLGTAWCLGAIYCMLYTKAKTQTKRRILLGAVAGLLLLSGSLTFSRNMTLGHPLSLWEHTAKRSPNKARVQLNLGIYQTQAKQYRRALRSLQRAMRLEPKKPDIHYNLGVFFEKVRSPAQAASAYQQAHKLEPSPKHKNALVRAHNRAGSQFFRSRKWKEATHHFRAAIHLNPRYFIAHFNLAMTYVNVRKWKKARHHLGTVLQLNPLHSKAKQWLHQLPKE